jgi:hypothetical protein
MTPVCGLGFGITRHAARHALAFDDEASPPRAAATFVFQFLHARPRLASSLQRYSSCRLAFWGLSLAGAQDLGPTAAHYAPQSKQLPKDLGIRPADAAKVQKVPV